MMPWWGWTILGVLLFSSELMVIDAAFYLVFIGLAAIVTGLVGLLGLELEYWGQWLLFSGLSLVSMALFRAKLYSRLRGGAVGYDTNPSGDILTLEQSLEPGDSCRMAYRGTSWKVLNSGNDTLVKGSKVKISSIEGLTLKVGLAPPINNSVSDHIDH